MKKQILITLLLVTVPSCTKNADVEPAGKLVNFNDSVEIIVQLIRQDNLKQILEDADPEGIDLLIKNFSPAELAFESEVLHCILPVVLYFYDTQNDQRALLEELAVSYSDQVKFVAINAKDFPTIVKKAEVEQTPTFMFIKDRQELNRLEGDSKKAVIVNALQLFLPAF